MYAGLKHCDIYFQYQRQSFDKKVFQKIGCIHIFLEIVERRVLDVD